MIYFAVIFLLGILLYLLYRKSTNAIELEQQGKKATTEDEHINSSINKYSKSLDLKYKANQQNSYTLYNTHEIQSVLDISEFINNKTKIEEFTPNKKYLATVYSLFTQTYAETNKKLSIKNTSRIKSLYNFSELLVKSVHSCTKNSTIFQTEVGFMFHRVCNYFFLLCENKVRIDFNYPKLPIEALPTFTPKTKKEFELVYTLWIKAMDELYNQSLNQQYFTS